MSNNISYMYTRNLRSNIPSTICSVERDSKKSWYLPQNERILRAHYKVVYRLHMSLNIYLYKLRLKRFWPIFIEQEWFYAVKVYYLPLFNNLIGLVPMRNRPIKGLITTSYTYDRYKKNIIQCIIIRIRSCCIDNTSAMEINYLQLEGFYST
jgi:hypothetical protein